MIHSFGERLKILRKEKNLTQQKMASMLNITQGAYNKYERNQTSPNPETLTKISEILEVSVDLLLGRLETEPQDEIQDGTVTMWGYGTGKVTVKLSKEELAVIEALIRAKNK